MNIFHLIMPIEGHDYFVNCFTDGLQAKSAKIHPIIDGVVYPPLLLPDFEMRPILDEVDKILAK